MAYTPQTWTNGVSKLNATRLNYIETGIEDAAADADAAIPAPANPSTNDGLFYNGTGWIADTIDNAKVAADAAIAYSKLNLSGSIVNADISASAAIALSKLSGSFSTYTPSWTASSSNPSLGNGTFSGRYIQIGKLVVVLLSLTAGSTTAYGTGDYSISLPVTSTGASCAGTAQILNASVQRYSTVALLASATTVSWVIDAVGLWGPSSPFTFGSGDALSGAIIYEAA